MNLRHEEKGAYSATGIDSGPYGPARKIDQLPDVVDVGASAVGEHGPAAGEPEPVALEPNPVLDRLLHRELPVRHVGVPRHVPARGPRERVLVAGWRRDPALDRLVPLGAMPLSEYQPPPVEPLGPLGVLARGVLAVVDAAWRVGLDVLAGRGVTAADAERRGDAELGRVDGRDGGVPPCAEEVRDEAEEEDEEPRVKKGGFRARTGGGLGWTRRSHGRFCVAWVWPMDRCLALFPSLGNHEED